jgi:hypothetical protein
MFDVPIAFLIFNRPELTGRVFAQIARVKPRRLLVIADGPRTDSEAAKCEAARAVIDRVDWECDVSTNYSKVNLGCKQRVASGLEWVFENCEEAIILEDDCLPHDSFFRFCAELLEQYRDNERVMAIGGNNFQFGRERGPHSYYFSGYTHIWGWASWRRAWKHFDLEMKQWPILREDAWLDELLGDPAAVKHWRETLDINYQGSIDTWDIPWLFTCWVQNGLTALPNKNLVSNIGFGADATHTKTDIYGVACLPMDEAIFPLNHPTSVERDVEADKFTFERLFAKEVDRPTLYRKLGRKIFSALPGFVREPVAAIRKSLR